MVTSVTESFDEVGSAALDVTLAVFEMDPPVPGAVTVIVNWTFAPLASDAVVHVTVPPDSEHPADADTKATAPGSVSVTVTSLAVPGPPFVTVIV